jgi:RHS repeat-associated protein
VLTPEIVQQAYGTQPPPYLVTEGAVNWGAEYPEEFRASVPQRAGYVYYTGAAGSGYHAGFYATSERRQYDFQRQNESTCGLVRVQRDALGRDTTIDYDAYGLLPIRVTNAAKLTQEASYDERVLRPSRVVDANNNVTLYRYTPLGLVATVTRLGKEHEAAWADKPTQIFAYDLRAYEETGQPLSATTASRERYPWELPQETPFPPDELAQHPERFVQTREYSDGLGRLLQTRLEADATGFGDGRFGDSGLPKDQAAGAADAVGTDHGDLTSPRVVVSGWQVYDHKGRVVERFEPFFANGWTYTAAAPEDRRSRVTMTYDALGRLVETRNPDGSSQRTVYGVPGTIEAPRLDDPATFEPTPWISYAYDANDNAGRTHPSESSEYETHWDTPSSARVDALGRVVEAVARSEADGYATESTYDIRGNLLTLTDPLGRTAFSCVYDLLDRPLRLTQLDSGTEVSLLDAGGNTIEARDAKDALVLARFDELNRPTRRWARDRAGESVTLRERVVYGDTTDAAEAPADAKAANLRGRIYRAYDEAGLLESRAYDHDGNLLEKARQMIRDEKIVAAQGTGGAANWKHTAYRVDWTPGGTASFASHAASLLDPTAYVTSSTFDALGRATSVRHPAAPGGARRLTTLVYSRGGAVKGVKLDGEVYVERIAYNARGQRILVAYGNGVMTRYAYDDETFRLARLRTERYTTVGTIGYRGSGEALQDFAFEYDLIGNVRKLHDRTPGCGIGPSPDELDRAFVYDPLYRLKSATGREAGAVPSPPWSALPRGTDPNAVRAYAETYDYDPVGNLLSLMHTNAPTRHMSLGAGNRLATLSVGAAPTSTTYAYGYDASGNMLHEQTRLLEWDHADRLQSFRVQPDAGPPSIYVQFFYDPGGQRVKKLVRTGGNDLTGRIETTTYVDGFEVERVVTRAGTTAPVTQETSSVNVMDGVQRIAHVRLAPALQGDQTPAVKYHLGDHLGSSNLVLDETAAWINREEYTPYGDTSYGGIAHKRYRFSGKERDAESGLLYYGARYYSSWAARWISCDPAGQKDGLNLYAYARLNPVVYVDPTGTQSENSFEDLATFVRNQAGFVARKDKPPAFDPRDASRAGTAAHAEATEVLNEMKEKETKFKGAERMYSEVRIVNGVVEEKGGKPKGPKGAHNLDLVQVPKGTTLEKGQKVAGGTFETIGDIKYGGGKIDPKYAVYGAPLKTIDGVTQPTAAVSTTPGPAAAADTKVNRVAAAADAASNAPVPGSFEKFVKGAGEVLVKKGGKVVPFVGAGVGGALAAKEAYEGNYAAAFVEAAGASEIPVVAQVADIASLTADVAWVAKEAFDPEQKLEQWWYNTFLR